MKILLINDYSTETGGAEIHLLNVQDELRKRGHDARLFASSARPQGASGRADYECFGTVSRWRTPLQAANPWAYARLRRVLAEFQPDVVHVAMFLTQLSPWILPLLAGIPSLMHAVWYRPICPVGTKTLPDGSACTVSAGAVCCSSGCLPLRDWLVLMPQMHLWRRWRGVFDQVTACSGYLGRTLEAAGVGPVEAVWSGVPTAPSRPPLTSPPTVVFAGRLVPEKGVEMLVQAFRLVLSQVPDARLIIAGEGQERERLTRLADDLGLASQISLPGHLSRPEMETLFTDAWVQVIPSRWAEPFGLVAVEAMMRGTAVIAGAQGGLTEIVQDGVTGFLVSQHDAQTWAKPLTMLLCSREQAEIMGRAGRERALAEFSIEVCTDRFYAIYERLCRKGTLL